MDNGIQNQYTPDYVSPPGETLLETIEEQGLSQAELAERMGRPKKTVNEIIQGKASITSETALQLERVLGVPSGFWINREQQYRQYQTELAERIRLSKKVAWLHKFPVKVMIERGWIKSCNDEVGQLRELLNFFGVASPKTWSVIWSNPSATFRKTPAFQSNIEDVSAWLRRGEIEAQDIHCQPYSTKTFRQVLVDIRPLTLQSPQDFVPTLIHLCAGAGVAVVFVPQLPKSRVSGATRWLTPTKALIQLSLRYKTNDHLWFTFFHEAGHILEHGKRDVFLEVNGMDNEKEQEANEFAASTLIPSDALTDFLNRPRRGRLSKKLIQDFATEIGIAPGIVVGQLQHGGHLPYSNCNVLKQKLEWTYE